MITVALITVHAPTLIGFRAQLIKTLHSQGVRVFGLAPNFDEHTRAAVKALGAIPIDCPMSRTGMNPVIDLVNTWKLAMLLRNLRPNITLGYFVKPVIFGSIAAWWARVPRRYAMVEGLGFVFTPGVGGFSFGRRVLKRLVMILYKVGFSAANRVIFLNPDDQAELVAAGLLPFDKSFLLGGIGVDLNQWPKLPSVMAPVTFLFVARLLREKGIETYANAARVVKKQYPKVRFIILGGLDDNPGALNQRDVQAWVDEGILEWHGHVPVQPWMKQTSVFVLPSFYREGVPASTQEAMASGRAVITTDAPGCRETVVEGDNGFLVPVRDPKALAQAMCKFIEQPELIASMGARSRQMAEEKYDVHNVNAVMLREMGLL